MLFGDRAFLPGPLALWDSDWVVIPASAISAADIAFLPFSPGFFSYVGFFSCESPLACWWF